MTNNYNEYIILYIYVLHRVAPKKRPILFFIPKLCFTIFFPYFSGGVDSRPRRFF